jgi:hypothetical protein
MAFSTSTNLNWKKNDSIYMSNDVGDGSLAIFSHSCNRTGVRSGRSGKEVAKPET